MTVTRKTTRPAQATPWIIGALCALLPLTSEALGLGRLKVHSALNQPLNAEIEFTSLTEAETKGLTVGLAGRADFTAAGIDRAAHLSQIKFTVSRRADGRQVLRLTTPTPFQEPFLHLLLQLDWTGGRLVREYTALVDPPTVIAAKAPTVEPPRTVPKAEPATPESKPETFAPAPIGDEPLGPPAASGPVLSEDGWPSEAGEGAATAAPKAAAPRSAAKGRIGPAPSWATTARHTVRRGETLWSISEKVRRDTQVSVQQAAMAIYRNNPDAFYDGNLNNIRAGKILRMPARSAVDALSREQAHVAFQEQFDAWQAYKRRLAGANRTVAVDDVAEDEKSTAQARPEGQKPEAEKPKTAEASARKETATAVKGQRSDDLLKIVRANLQGEKGAGAPKAVEPSQKTGEREQAALAERADTLDESLASKQVEQKALREKLDLVRAQLKREARLIELESQALAPAAGKTDVPAETPGVVQGRTDDGAKDAKAEPPKDAKPETPKTEAPAAEPAKPEPPKTVAPAPEKPAAAPAAKKPLPPPPPPVAAEKDLFGTLPSSLSELFLPIVLGVVLLASTVIGMVYLRRRRRAANEFEESILASQAVATTENMPAREITGEASAAESSILSDISQGHIANIHTDEVDPIAEAEVYLAYGRDETAEEILKDAMVKHPQRQELKIKLLEIYAGRKDVKAFETLAEEVYAAVGGQGGKLWARVEELGQKVSPANPMFRGTGAAPARATEEEETAVAPTEVAPPPAAIPPETALDFDLGTSEVTMPASTKEDTFDLDFDLGETKPANLAPAGADKKPEPAPPAGKNTKPAAADFDLGLDSFDLGTPSESTVDFDLGQTSPVPSAPGKVASMPAADSDLSFDLSTPETGAVAASAADTASPPAAGAGSQHQWDEAATKLDLARAYIDMGDAEGARSILEEVVAEGNAEQKKQAQDLVAQIR